MQHVPKNTRIPHVLRSTLSKDTRHPITTSWPEHQDIIGEDGTTTSFSGTSPESKTTTPVFPPGLDPKASSKTIPSHRKTPLTAWNPHPSLSFSPLESLHRRASISPRRDLIRSKTINRRHRDSQNHWEQFIYQTKPTAQYQEKRQRHRSQNRTTARNLVAGSSRNVRTCIIGKHKTRPTPQLRKPADVGQVS